MTVERAVDQINRSHFLPAIQRPYVWTQDQVVALFDSLMKGYPISSFLFWELKPENRGNWDIYRFIENFKQDETRNETVDPDGRDITLVLDGQQRLTSLLIGLRGTYTIKLKNKRWDNPSAWVRQRLYLDLFKDAGAEDPDSDDIDIAYGFKFSSEELRPDKYHLWFKVGRILDFDSEDRFDRFKDELIDSLPDEVTRAQEKVARRNIERLYRMIWKDQIISYYTEQNQSYDRVLDIFVRANDGGAKLSKSDLLLSMITSKWEDVSAREEIYNFVQHLNNQLSRKNNFDKDFIMKSCLVLSDLDQRYKVENFTNKNLSLIQSKWPAIKIAIESTVRLVNRFGIDRDTLTSVNALLPIAYYIFKLNGKQLDGSTRFEVENSERIRRWLLGSLLNNAFGGNSDQTIGTSRSLIKESMETSLDFPQYKLVSGLLARRGRVINFDRNNIEALLETRYGGRSTFLALSLLYDDQNWTSSIYHIDHIVPRSLATRQKLMNRNIPESRISRILDSVDRIGNLQLMLGRENIEKSNDPFDVWIHSRDQTFLKKHLIPADKDLWAVERLPEFVAMREKLIHERLESINLDTSLPSEASSPEPPLGNSQAAAAE